MIDLDEIEQAARKPWYCRSKQDDNLLSPKVLVDLITSLRQAEKDAARYRWLRDKACHSEWHTVGSASPSEWDCIVDEYIEESGDGSNN